MKPRPVAGHSLALLAKRDRGQVMRKMKAASLPDLARMADKLNLTAEQSQSC
jgi:FixJ family two-component response regulator